MTHSRNIYYKYLLCAKGCARCCAYRFQSPSPRPPGTPRLRGAQGALGTEKRKERTRPREGFWAELGRGSEQGAGGDRNGFLQNPCLAQSWEEFQALEACTGGGRSGNQA